MVKNDQEKCHQHSSQVVRAGNKVRVQLLVDNYKDQFSESLSPEMAGLASDSIVSNRISWHLQSCLNKH